MVILEVRTYEIIFQVFLVYRDISCYLNVEIVVVMFPMHGFLRKENILVDVLNSDTKNSHKNKEIL